MAEREGFEPPIPFRVCRFSRPVPSTTRPPLRLLQFYYAGLILEHFNAIRFCIFNRLRAHIGNVQDRLFQPLTHPSAGRTFAYIIYDPLPKPLWSPWEHFPSFLAARNCCGQLGTLPCPWGGPLQTSPGPQEWGPSDRRQRFYLLVRQC